MAGRKPKTTRQGDGSVEVRLKIPPRLAVLVDKLAADWDVSFDFAASQLLRQLDARVADGDATMFSLDIQHTLRDVRNERFGSITGDAIDYAKLHQSTRTKSGFVGVYANGKGFRAMAKDPKTGGERSIGTFETAVEAAWKRYQFYAANSLPYGELEIEMQAWRNPQDPSAMPFTGTDEELIEAIRQHSVHTGTTRIIFGPNNENVPGKHKPGGKPAPDVDSGMKIAGFDANNLPPEAKAILDADGE